MWLLEPLATRERDFVVDSLAWTVLRDRLAKSPAMDANAQSAACSCSCHRVRDIS